MKYKPVLVIEDDIDIRSLVCAALRYEGHAVLEASNGQEALSLLTEAPDDQLPGCILLDLMMPVMDGFTFLKNLSLLPHLHKIRIIVATAKGSIRDPSRLPSDVTRIQKPFDIDVLLSEIEKHCAC